MSGDAHIVLIDHSGALRTMLSGLEVAVRDLGDIPHALVGGLAVFARAGAHRATTDIDAALLSTRSQARKALARIARPVPGKGETYELETGVTIDLLLADPARPPPRPGIGRQREARRYGTEWAIDTADELVISTYPPSESEGVRVKVATVPALLALKTVAIRDPHRAEDKRASDRRDLWRMLTADPLMTPAHIRRLSDHAPPRLAAWVAEQLEAMLGHGADEFADSLRPMREGPSDGEDVAHLWSRLVAPNLGSES